MTNSTNQQPTSQKLTTEDVEVVQDMSGGRENYEEYTEKGQQDDYFETDISIAGHEAGEDDDNADF